MFCQLERLTPETVRCRNCGTTIHVPADLDPRRLHRRCAAAPEAVRRAPPMPAIPECIHRGEQVSTIGCSSCGGKSIELQVFSCAVHEECIIGPNREGIANCFACRERREDRALRVAFLAPALVVGGIERWMAALLRHLPATVKPVGIALGDRPPTDTVMCRELARFCPIHAPASLEETGRNVTAGVIRRGTPAEAVARAAERADVLLLWGLRGAQPVPPGFRGRVVLVSHGCCGWTREWILANLPLATDFGAVSAAAREAYPEAIRDRVAILHNGIELDRLTPGRPRETVLAELQLGPGQKVVGFVGRYSIDKNPEAVARAVAALPDEYRALFIGTGWEVDRFRESMQAIAGGRALFLDPPAHLGDYLQVLDCLMVPSPSEGFPLVIPEAWAAGVPVVSTSTGIVPEAEAAIGGPLTWRIAWNDSGEALAAQVEAACAGRFSERVQLARALAWQNFSAARMAARWESYLLGLAASQG